MVALVNSVLVGIRSPWGRLGFILVSKTLQVGHPGSISITFSGNSVRRGKSSSANYFSHYSIADALEELIELAPIL